MNEVEKMYENAGIKKDWTAIGFGDIEDCYPPFTAEKQLSLIKWLADTDNYIKEICRMIDTRKYCIETLCRNISMANNFEETLAGLINKLWQDLTNAERTQIKNILELEVNK